MHDDRRKGFVSLRKGRALHVRQLHTVLAAAPRLRVLHADVECDAAEAGELLRNEGPFRTLRLRTLFFTAGNLIELRAALGAVGLHVSLQRLGVQSWAATIPETVDAVADAAHALRLRHVFLQSGHSRHLNDAVHALVRLLASDGLDVFEVEQEYYACVLSDSDYYGAPTRAQVFADALRSSRVHTLHIGGFGFLRDTRVAELALSALVGHPTLRMLDLSREPCRTARAIITGPIPDSARVYLGSLLDALVTSPESRLEELNLWRVGLNEYGLRPLCRALRRTARLRVLDCSGDEVKKGFLARCLLPAVRRNTSLRRLRCAGWNDEDEDSPHGTADQAEQLVASRSSL